MKKSQMIKIIEDVLRNPCDYPAITILQKIEDMGMKPPLRKAKTWKEIGIDTEEFESPNFTVHMWESEDD